MANSTITGLPNATTPLSGSERVPMDQSGTTKDAAVSDIIFKVDKLTTKGDLLACTGSAAYARKAVGTNGQALLADSTQTDGLRWGTVTASGVFGGAVAIPYTFSTTTTNSDPGSGNLRLNNATQTSATAIYADLLDALATDWTAVLDIFDDSTSTIKGMIRLVKADDISKWLIFDVTALVSPSGYREITVTNVAGSTASPFANADSIVLCFTPTGDKGTAGVSGGTFATEYFVDLGTNTSFILNCSNSVRAFRCSPSANWSWSLAAVPTDASGILCWLAVEVNGASGFTSTLPSGGSWGVLGEPTWSAGVDLVTVYTRDGGTTSRWMLASPDS